MFNLNNNANAATGQPGYEPLFKIQPVIDTPITKFIHTRRTDDQRGNMPILTAILFHVYIKGNPP
jgi:hypothetical protein